MAAAASAAMVLTPRPIVRFVTPAAMNFSMASHIFYGANGILMYGSMQTYWCMEHVPFTTHVIWIFAGRCIDTTFGCLSCFAGVSVEVKQNKKEKKIRIWCSFLINLSSVWACVCVCWKWCNWHNGITYWLMMIFPDLIINIDDDGKN